MTLVSSLVLVLLMIGVAVVLPTVRRLLQPPSLEEITPEWLESFSPEIYQPMERLLSDEDFEFLSRQPGFDFTLHRKLRRERLQIFRMYLHRMIADFARLHYTARTIVLMANQDHSGLLVRLMWLKVRFCGTVLRADLAYRLCCLGVGTLPARALILRLIEMQNEMSLVAANQSA